MKRNMMIVLAAVFAAIFLFSGMMLWQDYRDQEASAEVFDNVANLIVEETQSATEPSAEDAETQPAEPTEPAAEMTAYEKYAAVYAQNNDFVGWLCIEGTNINYPVMQTPEEPNYYLKRAFDHSYSDYGVPYVQENCALGISDNIVIYGHNMSNGSMFADLCRYEKESFWEAHPIIHFDTLSGYGEYEIVTVFKTVAYSQEGFKYYHFVDAENEADFDAFLAQCRELALYDTGVDAEYGDQLITLSTCEYSRKNGRMVIVAKKIVPPAAVVDGDA